MALAAVGITLTVATVFSLGATLPEKAGVSTIKIVNRAGRLSRPLRRQVFALAREAVDTDALRNVGRSLGAFDLTAVRTAARRIVRPAPAAKLKQLGADVATLGENAGYRGTLDALAKAKDATAISRMARLSKTLRQGDARRAVHARRRRLDAGLGRGRRVLVVDRRRVLDHRRDLGHRAAGGLAAAAVVRRAVVAGRRWRARAKTPEVLARA